MPDVVSQSEATRAFAKIGLLSFGGPAAQISVMHRILVEEKKWLSEKQFLHALNFCMLLPGPEAMQLSTYAGWLLHGVRGGLIAGLLFIVPGLVMMLALSAIYVSFGDVPLIGGLFYGLKAAVLAIVAQALLKISKKALGSNAMAVIALAAFIGIAFLKIPFPAIVLGAGFLGAALWRFTPQSMPPISAATDNGSKAAQKDQIIALIKTLLVWGAIWAVPLILMIASLGGEHVFAKMAVFFSQVAVVTFGGAYAVLAYVGQQAVEAQNWLTANDMLAGLGLAETTLGPLVLVLVFVGFMGGAGASMSLSAGLFGGLIAAFFTFVPCFLWIFVGAPFVERLRHIAWLQASLAAITASVVGVIANLALWFGLNVLFGTIGDIDFGPFVLPWPELASIDFYALIIAILSAVALLRFNSNMMIVLAAAALAGAATSFFVN